MSDSGELAALRQQAESDAATLLCDARLEAQQLLTAARAEAEALRSSAEQTAAALVQRAQQQAATIEERGRQELLWCRRQLRRERDVITRSQRALVEQSTILSGVAAETARRLYAPLERNLSEDKGSAELLDDEVLHFPQSMGA